MIDLIWKEEKLETTKAVQVQGDVRSQREEYFLSTGRR